MLQLGKLRPREEKGLIQYSWWKWDLKSDKQMLGTGGSSDLPVRRVQKPMSVVFWPSGPFATTG